MHVLEIPPIPRKARVREPPPQSQEGYSGKGSKPRAAPAHDDGVKDKLGGGGGGRVFNVMAWKPGETNSTPYTPHPTSPNHRLGARVTGSSPVVSDSERGFCIYDPARNLSVIRARNLWAGAYKELAKDNIQPQITGS